MGRILGVACGMFSVLVPLQGAEGEAEARLAEQWKAMRSEVVSAMIKHRFFRIGGDGLRNLTPEEVKRLVSSVDLTGRPADLKKLIDGLATKTGQNPKPWADKEFILEGKRAKENALDGPPRAQILDGDTKIDYDGTNAQARLSVPGDSKVGMLKLRDFRLVPVMSPGSYEVEGQAGAVVKVRAKQLVGTVDRETGIPLTVELFNSDGSLNRQFFQGGLTIYRGGIVFPGSTIQAVFRRGRLSAVSVSVIDEAEFNGEIRPDAFALSVATPTVAIDQRFGKTGTVRVPAGERDVVGFVNRASVIPLPESPSRFVWWYAAFPATVVLVCAWYWKTRARLSGRTA